MLSVARPEFGSEEARKVNGYCMKCRAERPIDNGKTVTMKNGRPATQGNCPKCGTRMFRLGKA